MGTQLIDYKLVVFGRIFLISNYDHSSIPVNPTYALIDPAGTTYEQLGGQLNFVEDFAGVSNWVMRPPRTIYSSDMRTKHTFTSEGAQVERINESHLEERWKYFVITKGDAKRFYCTAQVYYERGHIKVR